MADPPINSTLFIWKRLLVALDLTPQAQMKESAGIVKADYSEGGFYENLAICCRPISSATSWNYGGGHG